MLQDAAPATQADRGMDQGRQDTKPKNRGLRREAGWRPQDYATKLKKDAEAVDIATEPLSKSWPEPDYDKLLAGGADPYVVAFVHAARDEFPPSPSRRGS